MTKQSRIRRDIRHWLERLQARHRATGVIPDIAEPRSTPRLSWLNSKTRSGFANHKQLPGRKPEHADALYEYAYVVEEKSNATGQDLQDHQGEAGDVAA
jgi:hypothetical protein